MQPLEDDDRELALPAELEPAEAQPTLGAEGERTAPLPRRLVLHGMLAVLATPLSGGLLLGARAIACRNPGSPRLAAL